LIKFESVAGAEVEVKYFRLHHRRPSSTWSRLQEI
jgi:hypothetical protein